MDEDLKQIAIIGSPAGHLGSQELRLGNVELDEIGAAWGCFENLKVRISRRAAKDYSSSVLPPLTHL
jgi:hypothetical protein